MNFSRSLAGFLSSSNPKKWHLVKSASALHYFPFSTAWAIRTYQKSSKTRPKDTDDLPVEPPIPKDQSKLQRPSLIPFQPMVANIVHLVGTIDSTVKLQQLSDGSYASVSIIVNENVAKPNAPRFWIPVIFQGDLAEIAACHLKENDLIYVSGQLTGDNLVFIQEEMKENIKLIAHSLNYVEEASSPTKSQFVHKKDVVSTSDSGDRKITDYVRNLWEELVIDPHKWLDNREGKLKGLLSTRSPDFKHKENGNALWLNNVPGCVVPKLEGLVFGDGGNIKPAKSNFGKSACKDELWKKFMENPNKWWDNRPTKRTPTQPDFRHKDDGDALWLNSAPSWVLPKLPPLPTEKNW